MSSTLATQWTYLFVLQELDLQLAVLQQQRVLAESLRGGVGLRLADDNAAQARRALPLTESRIRELEEERRSVALLLPRTVLRPYERLKDAGVPPPWVARTSKPRCPGCNGDLSPAAVREASVDRAPLRCESCWRLLFLV
ncbi:MAG: hypothetical protein ACAI38_24355 [Myxococcota bacterium]|nr:hypothetical protein [Myxococcota bacterium]